MHARTQSGPGSVKIGYNSHGLVLASRISDFRKRIRPLQVAVLLIMVVPVSFECRGTDGLTYIAIGRNDLLGGSRSSSDGLEPGVPPDLLSNAETLYIRVRACPWTSSSGVEIYARKNSR
jgi:hypothetical protein